MKQWIIEELFHRFNKHCSARAIFNFDIPIISSLQPSEKSYLNCWLHKSSNQETDIRLEIKITKISYLWFGYSYLPSMVHLPSILELSPLPLIYTMNYLLWLLCTSFCCGMWSLLTGIALWETVGCTNEHRQQLNCSSQDLLMCPTSGNWNTDLCFLESPTYPSEVTFVAFYSVPKHVHLFKGNKACCISAKHLSNPS